MSVNGSFCSVRDLDHAQDIFYCITLNGTFYLFFIFISIVYIRFYLAVVTAFLMTLALWRG